MPNTNWSVTTDYKTDWNRFYLYGRHTYGAEWGETTRIVYGDNVRFGGIANQDRPRVPSWSATTSYKTSWT